MGYKKLLLCLSVFAVVWAKPENVSDLNLKSIFRTPKDFSKVNFDHFELLERNNFDDDKKPTVTSPIENNGTTKAEEASPKSVANAQVLLRIGGEDIRDCNRVILQQPPKEIEKNVDLKSRSQLVLPLLSTNNIGYPSSPVQSFYSYPPSPALALPGGCHNSAPLPNYLPSPYQTIHGNLLPNTLLINSPETEIPLKKSEEENIFVDLPGSEKVTVCRESPIIELEKPNQYTSPAQEIEILDASTEPCLTTEKEVFVPQTELVETTVSAAGTDPSLLVIPTSDCIDLNNIETTTINPNPLPDKLEYVEINLDDARKPCLDTPKDNIVSLLDQAVVPLSCQKCSEKRSLVSYPIVREEETACQAPAEEILVTECPSCSHNAFCPSCSRERNPMVPYGHRFSKDLDSLYDIIDDSHDFHVPSNLYNEAESYARVQSALPLRKLKRISTIVPAEENCPYEHKGKVEIIEATQPHCVTQETIQENNIESSTLEQISAVVPAVADCQSEWRTQPYPPIHVNRPYIGIIVPPCAAQEVMQVSNLRQRPLAIQAPSTTEEVVQVNDPYRQHFTPQAPYSSQEMHYQEPYVIQPSCGTREMIQNNQQFQESYSTLSPYSVEEVAPVSSPYQQFFSVQSPCAPQQLFQVSQPYQDSYAIQSPHSTQEVVYASPCQQSVPTYSPYDTQKLVQFNQDSFAIHNPYQGKVNQHYQEPVSLKAPCAQEYVSLNNRCKSPCVTQEVAYVSNQYQEPVNAQSAQQEITTVLPIITNYQTSPQELLHTRKQYQEPVGMQGAEQDISTVLPTITNYQTQWSPQQLLTSSYPNRNLLQSLNPCQGTQDVVQVSSPYSEPIANEAPCVGKESHAGGYSSNYNVGNLQFKIDVSSGNEESKVSPAGYKSTCGSGYPLRSIIYNQPTVGQPNCVTSRFAGRYQESSPKPFLEILGLNSTNCVNLTSRMEHYEQEPRFVNIQPRLGVTNRRELRTCLEPSRQYLPIYVPLVIPQTSRHCIPVDRVPLVNNLYCYYTHGWPFWKSVPVNREIPLAPNYVPHYNTCTRYKGELNELDS